MSANDEKSCTTTAEDDLRDEPRSDSQNRTEDEFRDGTEDEFRSGTGAEPGDGASASVECDAQDEADDAHLEGLADGIGCTEIWEHLSEQRDDDDG